VAGGGPAGCAVAVGLSRLGYRVLLVHSARPWPSCEGISARACEGLRNAGLLHALSAVPAASRRRVSWNGESSDANTEHLVLRQRFDVALLEDAAAAGVQLLAGRLRRVSQSGDNDACLHIETPVGRMEQWTCRFMVDARGRSAAAGRDPVRGPETVSLLQLREGPPTVAGSRVSSFAGGWAWFATTDSGLSFIQLTVTSDAQRLPKRGELGRWFEAQLQQLQPAPELSGRPTGDVIARGSTSILQGELVTSHSLRAGDAAMAVDPLSGNGIFQSLSSALIAPAVINTLLQYPAERDLATRFYRDRVHHSFFRFARMGRDFYRMEGRWQASEFWRQRQAWPDDEPSHSDAAPALLGVENRPVVADGRIRLQAVAVTSDQPLGVWHVGGVELAPLLQALPASPAQRRAALATRLADTCAGDATQHALLQSWLRRYALL
jgi:flavin-dependent dehydrogenase